MKPEIGMGATHQGWTDRRPYTIIEVCNDRRIVVQADLYRIVGPGATPEYPEYEFTPDPDGGTRILTLRSNGRWVIQGQNKNVSESWGIGFRKVYDSPSS